MYFLTDKDPNYIIKGSRDPLGFQVIWQPAARRLVPYLSTVSGNVKDFQILCTAYTLKHQLNISDKDFEPFFIRFEQLMAYTRYSIYPKEGFNGIDKVRKIMSESPASVRISNKSEDQILSNQRAYGIWGKYIRPFKDMQLFEPKLLDDIFGRKISNNKEFLSQVNTLKRKSETKLSYASVDRFKHWGNLLLKPTGKEKNLFIDKLLVDTCGRVLLNLFNTNPNWLDLDFYPMMQSMIDSSSIPQFNTIANFIVNTEKVLSPLNKIFRYLQTKSFWKISEIESDEYIKKWRTVPDTLGFDETSYSLASLLSLDNLALVKGLIKRNEEVANWRNSSPWMQLTNSGIEVNHFEGGYFYKDYNPAIHNDFNYFFSTYKSLYKQVQ